MEVRLGPVPTPQGTQGNVFVVPSPQSPDARNKNPTHLDMLKAITALTFPPFFIIRLYTKRRALLWKTLRRHVFKRHCKFPGRPSEK